MSLREKFTTSLSVSLIVVGTATASAADPPLGEHDKQQRWAVLGASPDRRTLFIGAEDKKNTCVSSRVDVLDAPKGELKLRLVHEPVPGRDPAAPCQRNSDLKGPEVVRVRLPARLAGQRISGPSMLPPEKVYRYLRDPDDGTKIRSVVGLRTDLAVSILRAAGFRASDLRVVSRGADRYVESVSPKLPTRLKRSFGVTLTTR